MGSGAYYDYFWDRAAGLLIIDIARASNSTASLLGFRVSTTLPGGEGGVLGVVPFSPDLGEMPGYAVVRLPEAGKLQISVEPILDQERAGETDGALIDVIELNPEHMAEAPAEQMLWSIVMDHEAELEIRGELEPPGARPISNLYRSQDVAP